jgi:hypothetical protein
LRYSQYGSLRVEKLWVHNVDLSTFLNNAPGDTDATMAVEVAEEDDGKVDSGDVSDDVTEDGLKPGATLPFPEAQSWLFRLLLPQSRSLTPKLAKISVLLTVKTLCLSPTGLPACFEMSMSRWARCPLLVSVLFVVCSNSVSIYFSSC